MQRKPLIVRETAIAAAMMDAATAVIRKGGTLPDIVANYVPRRALKREPTWSVTRAKKVA